ncbi:hypothetical protein [Brachybacterium sp. FME24]|uniref:hypothetical protein n=1 Tax=Brachybacterium sp. FME24 TaxID=2742605 RepID=UPI001865E4FA|nr:hypothetical protein [Brachybacterium sp. FME24]
MHTLRRHDPLGLTRDAGWELGVRRTVAATAPDVWHRLLAEWLPQWLEVDSIPQLVGAPLRHNGSVRGRIVGCHMGRRVRMYWTPVALDHETVFQVTLLEASAGTTIAIHQERLVDAVERQSLLEQWTAILDDLVAALERETAVTYDLPS